MSKFNLFHFFDRNEGKRGFTQHHFYGKCKSGAGFTLVETLVAIAILNLAIATSFTVAQSGLSTSIFSKDQITAFYLAQEAFEFVRNTRDENALTGNPWLTGLGSCLNGQVCVVDSPNVTVAQCLSGSGNCPFITQNSTSGLYGQEVLWTPTLFKREVKIVKINDDEVAVTVTVYWTKGSLTRQFTARSNILNWQ